MIKKICLIVIFLCICSLQAQNGTYTNGTDSGDGTWDTATNWTSSILPGTNGIATLQRTIDLESNSYAVGQVHISGNTNTKTFSNGTIILNGTTSANTDQIIRNRSTKAITIACNVTVGVDNKNIHNRDKTNSTLIFGSSSTLALGSNTVNVDNPKEDNKEVNPIEFNGAVTGNATSSINITDQNMSIGSTADFSGFTGSITFGGTNGLLTINGANTIEGSIGVLAASDGNSMVEFKASQSGLANLSVDTQALALNFDAAATAVLFTGYTTSGTEGIVDLQNYVSGSLRIGTSTTVPSAVLATWTIDGAAATITQDADGYILDGPIPVQSTLHEVLKGSWGGRFYVRGGEDLDVYVAPTDQFINEKRGKGYDYIAGAQEIANSYPTMGHVITNGTNNASSHLWTLRTNPNVDVVMGAPNSVVDEEFVPSLANEQIIIDVINIFKNSGKKVILYINSLSPAERATDNGAAAWNSYVDTYFSDESNPDHKAWMNYCEGYIKRFNALGVDGYWLDKFGGLAGNTTRDGDNSIEDTDNEEKNEFVEMIRNIAPNAIIANNIYKHSFLDENGNTIYVDTDGINDTVGETSNNLDTDGDGTNDITNNDVSFEDDERDYAIIKMQASNPWSDFTAGHITPLAQGAPPNSWAYEEFTVSDIEENHISIFDGSEEFLDFEGYKQTLKHLFLPIRATWSSERQNLMFNKEQAYRFAKRITDAGGSVTFSNTTGTDGTTPDDEVEILAFINQQFTNNADATVYERPEGAFLVGEEVLSTVSNPFKNSPLKLFPNPVTNSFKLSKKFNSVTIYTITGAKILEFSENEDNFDVSNLNSGLYIIKAFNKNNTIEVIKFLKK